MLQMLAKLLTIMAKGRKYCLIKKFRFTYIHNGYRDVSDFVRFYIGVLAVEGES